MKILTQPETQNDFVLEALVDKLLDRVIAFHRIFATIGGGATEGLFLSQAYYWSKRTKNAEGWFYKTQEEWHEETALTRREQETARRSLVQKGILEEQRKGIPSKLFYRINKQRLYELIYLDTGSNPCGCKIAKSDKQECHNVQTSLPEIANNNVISGKQSIYTEKTNKDYPHETTSSNTDADDAAHTQGGEEEEFEDQEQRQGTSRYSPRTVNKQDCGEEEKSNQEDQNSAARREVGTTSYKKSEVDTTLDAKIGWLELAGIQVGKSLKKELPKYMVDEVVGAIGCLVEREREEHERPLEPIKNRAGFVRSALQDNYLVDLFDKWGYNEQQQEMWLWCQKALLLEIFSQYSIEYDEFRREFDGATYKFSLSKCLEYEKHYGWAKLEEAVVNAISRKQA